MRRIVEALLADRTLHIIDDEGRPLTEQADPLCPETEEAICPYKGPRLGSPINPAALAQVNRHWKAIREDLRQTMPAQATLQQAFQASLEMVSAPLLWTLAPPGDPDLPRPETFDPPQRSLPGFLAARYKAGVGFCQVFAWLLLQEDGQGRRPLASLGSGREFVAWVEKEGWLKGERQACAGTGGQIAALFEAFGSGLGAGPPDTAVLAIVALQTALLLGTYAALREGQPAAHDCLGCRLMDKGRAPWLFAVTARPNVAPAAVRRLFAEGAVALAVERFLAAEPAKLSHEERESLFWTAALEVPTGGLLLAGEPPGPTLSI